MTRDRDEDPAHPRRTGTGPKKRPGTLTMREVADRLRISRRHVILLIEGGYLDAVAAGRIGRRDIGVRAEDLERFVASRDPFTQH